MKEMSPDVLEIDRSTPVLSAQLVRDLIHWGVVVIICSFIFVLRVRRELDNASVTAAYGLVLGHVGTIASQRVPGRARESPDA